MKGEVKNRMAGLKGEFVPLAFILYTLTFCPPAWCQCFTGRFRLRPGILGQGGRDHRTERWAISSDMGGPERKRLQRNCQWER